jgi:hypothetical protein
VIDPDSDGEALAEVNEKGTSPEEAFQQGELAAVTSGAIKGHENDYIKTVCERLKIAAIHWEEVSNYILHEKNIFLKDYSPGVPSLPAIVMIRKNVADETGHVVLLTDSGRRVQNLSSEQLVHALIKEKPIADMPYCAYANKF